MKVYKFYKYIWLIIAIATSLLVIYKLLLSSAPFEGKDYILIVVVAVSSSMFYVKKRNQHLFEGPKADESENS